MRNINIFLKDLDYITSKSNVDFSKFDNKTILVTGATGLIGFNVISALLYYSIKNNKPLKVIALVRNIIKTKELFSNFKTKNLIIKKVDMEKPIKIDGNVDYTIHAASFTHSRDFVERPLDVINFAINSTKNLLNLAIEKKTESFLYVSSVEVYGSPTTETKIDENYCAFINTMDTRSSYPESKRMCENICRAYSAQHDVPTKVIRLAQTIGPGMAKDDNRVFAYFARCVLNNGDIVLKTRGNSKKMYLYTADAVTAVLTVLLHGKNGEAYNVANEKTYFSIFEMAKLFSRLSGKIKVKFEIDNSAIYPKPMKLNLSVAKIKKINWIAKTNIDKMITNLCKTID